MKWIPALLLVALAAAAVSPATAQDKKERATIRVEIKDGRVLVNGQEVDAGDADTIQIEKEDGKVVTVRLKGDGASMWVGDEDHRFAVRDGMFSIDGNDFAFKGDLADRLREYNHAFDGHAAGWLQDPKLHLEAADGLTSRFGLLLNPETRELERRISELARRVRRADDADVRELEEELDQLLAEAFEAKLAAERRQAEELQERLTALQDRLAERAQSRAEIIARRKSQLLGERDRLDW